MPPLSQNQSRPFGIQQLAMSDEQSSLVNLIQRARDGGAAERAELFASCRSYLAIIARAQVETWLRAKVDPSDLVQQTMLEAHRDFDRFAGRTQGEWLAWLRRILSHNAHDFVRHYRGTAKRQARREVRIQSPPDASGWTNLNDPVAPDETPSQQLIRRDNQLRWSPPDRSTLGLPRGYHAPQPATTPLRAGRRAHESHPPRRTNAMDARDQKATTNARSQRIAVLASCVAAPASRAPYLE